MVLAVVGVVGATRCGSGPDGKWVSIIFSPRPIFAFEPPLSPSFNPPSDRN